MNDTPTPAAMAAEALERLGQTAGDNPVMELFGLTDEISARVRRIREQLAAPEQHDVDFDEYGRLRDAMIIALAASVHVCNVLEAETLAEVYGTAGHAGPIDDAQGHAPIEGSA